MFYGHKTYHLCHTQGFEGRLVEVKSEIFKHMKWGGISTPSLQSSKRKMSSTDLLSSEDGSDEEMKNETLRDPTPKTPKTPFQNRSLSRSTSRLQLWAFRGIIFVFGNAHDDPHSGKRTPAARGGPQPVRYRVDMRNKHGSPSDFGSNMSSRSFKDAFGFWEKNPKFADVD